MKSVYVIADNIYSPIGPDTATNLNAVIDGVSGIKQITDPTISVNPFYASLLAPSSTFSVESGQTRFQSLCIKSISNALSQTEITLSDEDTVFILATTKGNIELLEDSSDSVALQDKLSLFNTANLIAKHFKAVNQPLVVSNACISGVAAVILAKRLLESNRYKHAVITGADVISRFVVSGFQCLYAMSDKPCKPFDENRNGITLGECAATMVLTTNTPTKNNLSIKVNGGALTNDANHISGPSRTGAELSHAINTAIKHSGIAPEEISFTSTHGTATVYNDEMEAKALSLSGCLEIPLHSLKGNYGHTLGAAGVLESILTYQSLRQGIILPSKNFEKPGVSEKITVNTTLVKSNKQHALKTASGFGGCNAALIYSII